MNDKLMKLMEKKKKDSPEMDPIAKNAKMASLKSLRDEMMGMMKGDLEGSKLNKVEVAADDKEGLAEGLDKAKDILGEMPESEEDEEMSPEGSYEEEAKESHAHPVEEMEAIAEQASPEDLEAMIQKLEILKAKKSM
jgi:hypothetical protein